MAKARLLQTERDRHLEAFEVYYSLGLKRSFREVANRFGVSVGSLKNWSRSFDWRRRIAERDGKVAREVANRTLNDEVSRRERNLKIVEMSLIRLAKSISDGRIKMCLTDLDRLLRLESFLRDEPDSRQEIVFADLRNKSTEELREMVREEVEMLKELEVAGSAIENCEPETKPLDG
jgi:ribosomal protein L29